MRTRTRIVALAAVLAALLAAGLAAAAPANELLFGETRIQVKFEPMHIVAPLGTVSCEVVLKGSLTAATLAKTAGGLVGEITEASVSFCTGGTVTALRLTLPWHFYYSGFTGALPDITGLKITLVGVSLQATVLGTTCLARTTTTFPARATATVVGTTVDPLVLDESATIPLTGSSTCTLGTARVAGSGAISGEDFLHLAVSLV